MDAFTLKQRLILRIAPVLGKFLIFFLGKSCRIIHENGEIEQKCLEDHSGYILAFWHGRQLMLVYTHKNRGIRVLVSQSFDGELISRTIHKFGISTVRGSSTRGGKEALETIIQHLKSNHIAAFTPDGPRGPLGTVAPGVIFAASRSGKPIIPLTTAAKRKSCMKSWDRFMIPHPFTRIIVMRGTPVLVPPDLTPDTMEHYRTLLKTELDRISRLADEMAGNQVSA